jgi:predicted dehydrogenase
MSGAVRIALAGAGLIGRRHAIAIEATREAALSAIVDPTDTAREFAGQHDVTWYASLSEMIAAGVADGVILATPNQVHADNALECIAAGLPVLVEKPIAADVASGERLVAAADAAKVPVLVGHHRRHNELIQRAKAEIDAGSIGRIVSFSGTTWFYKPDDYFDVEWRRRPGAGPVYLNLIHDIDLMHCFCGPVETVHAMESNTVRGNAVEETAVVVFRFASGALGTVNVSDTIVAPWSWELTARENPAYPPTSEPCYLVGGTHGSLELPGLRLWRNREKRSWWEPIDATQLPFGFEDPLNGQIRHFAAVIRGEEVPLVSGKDGLQALRVIEAVKHSARTGETVTLGESP